MLPNTVTTLPLSEERPPGPLLICLPGLNLSYWNISFSSTETIKRTLTIVTELTPAAVAVDGTSVEAKRLAVLKRL